jgi:hypothetical protein
MGLLFNRHRRSFSGIKWEGREIEHLPPFSAEIKNDWDKPPLLYMASRRGEEQFHFSYTECRSKEFRQNVGDQLQGYMLSKFRSA